jgi:hypothetical protein
MNGATARLTRTQFIQRITKDYPRLSLDAGELPVEEGAGAGIGLSLLFLISLGAWLRKPAATTPPPAARGYLVSLGAWIALAVYMAKIGSEAAPRLIAAYYPLCFALALIHPGNTALTRRRWWRAATLLASLSIFPALILNPARPLLPVTSLLRAVPGLPIPFISRINTVYTVYAQRSRVLAPLTRYIPPGDRAVAFLGGDDPSTSLWLPFGGRRVVDFSPGVEDRILARYPGILLIASRNAIEATYGKSPQEWIRERGARIIAEEPILVKIQRGAPDDWYVLAPGSPGGGK